MSSTDGQPGEQIVDRIISRYLARRYPALSRRSFLSMLTRQAIRVAGITVAAEVLPFLPSDAQAQSVGCGLHGYQCDWQTTCNSGDYGAVWVRCCEIPSCVTYWFCVAYRDRCGTQPPDWGTNCHGNYVKGSDAWCGAVEGDYICTDVTVQGMHTSQTSCNNSCKAGPVCAW
jgi:hypothetical protein